MRAANFRITESNLLEKIGLPESLSIDAMRFKHGSVEFAVSGGALPRQFEREEGTSVKTLTPQDLRREQVKRRHVIKCTSPGAWCIWDREHGLVGFGNSWQEAIDFLKIRLARMVGTGG